MTAVDQARRGGRERVRPRQGHDRIPAALGGTGKRQVAVLAPQEETAPVVIGPEEMDCEHSVHCTGRPLPDLAVPIN